MAKFTPLPDRFWPRVDKSGDCWLWTGARMKNGYGVVWLAEPIGRMGLVHRVAWELTNGPIPDGLFACHRCDNPPCCNPDHLFLGTVRDNALDMVAKGRSIGHGIWALNWAACRDCGTTNRKHMGFGRCERCYSRRRYRLAHPGFQPRRRAA